MQQVNNIADEKTDKGYCKKHDIFYPIKVVLIPMAQKSVSMRVDSCPMCEKEKKENNKLEQIELATKKRVESITNSNISDLYKNATFSSYIAIKKEQKEIKAELQAYAESFETCKNGYIFLGNMGTGKTHLATSIILKLIETGLACYYSTLKELFRKIYSTYREDAEETELKIFNFINSLDLLVIDEFNPNLITAKQKELLFDILDSRYSKCKKTILISNLTPREFANSVDVRVLDRFSQTMIYKMFGWDSHRKNMLKLV